MHFLYSWGALGPPKNIRNTLEYIKSISNHDKKPSLNDFLSEHQGFIDERERLNLSENEIVPINVAKINKLIRLFNDTNYSNVDYTRNIIWDS